MATVKKPKQPKGKRTPKRQLATNDQAIAQVNRAAPGDELGTTGLLQFAGLVEETYLRELRWPGAYAKYNEMQRRDPTIASLLNAIRLLARTAIWTVEPASSDPVDQQAAEFLEQCLGDMSVTIEDVTEDLLTAIPFGWSWSEIVYKRRKGPGAKVASQYDDEAIGWRKFAPRRQSSFYYWEFDETGGVQGLWQMIAMDPKSPRFIPIQKSIHFTAQRDAGNPEGLAIFEPIYEPWHFVKNLQIINGIGFERSFVGLPKFTYGTPDAPYTPQADDKALVAKTGKGLRVDEKAYIALPGQIGFELVTTSNPNATSLLDTIKQYRIWMLQVALADFIALGTIATGGSYALGQDKSELFLMAVDGWLDKLAHVDKLGVLNRYAVPRLFDYNTFEGITDYPRIKHSSVQKPNLPALSSYLSSLTAFITPNPDLEAELLRTANLPQAPEIGQGGPKPQTGVEEDAQSFDSRSGGDVGRMAEPHPQARGQRYWQMEFRRALGAFNEAMK